MNIATFETHGFVLRSRTEDQVNGDCPLCDAKGKFYVNTKTKLWDCKKCGANGNAPQFLEEISALYANALKISNGNLGKLAANRKLPKSVFTSAGVGYNGSEYTLPVRGTSGSIVDIRRYSLKTKVPKSTKGCTVGLYGAEYLMVQRLHKAPVYLCEGEWDTLALRWLLQKLKVKAVVVGVPGADILKDEWCEALEGRDVVVLYDNDPAGERGELKVAEKLSGVASSIKYLHWPANYPAKNDIRDWIVYGSMYKKTPKKCWGDLQKLFKDSPRQKPIGELQDDSTVEVAKKKVSHKQVYTIYKKWLHMKNDEALAVMYGTILANRLEGDPLWMFLIAPPGGMKSELLMSLENAKECFLCSSLTPAALVSGANFTGGDPSLLPKLNGKMLIIKDFTTTLTMHPTSRDEIFGQLRDAYDGKYDKQFGNGIHREYHSRFGIIAGCTPSIDAFSSLNSGLGERFLKYRFETELEEKDEQDRIFRSIFNINKENKMRADLCSVSKDFLLQKSVARPTIPDDIVQRMVDLAKVISRLRGVVHRDKYQAEMLHAKATHEIGTRIGKQFGKLATGIAAYRGLKKVDDATFLLVAKIGIGSIPDKVEEIVRILYEENRAMGTTEINEASTKLTQSTVYRALQDLRMLGVVKQEGAQNKKMWKLAEKIDGLLSETEIYE